MARKPGVTAIQYSGPFFEKDPAETLGRNARRLMDRVAEVGEAEVKRRIASVPTKQAGPPLSMRYVWGRTSNLSGKRWQATAVINVASRLGQQPSGAVARRVQASVAGRRNAIIQRSFTERGAARVGKSVGTMPGFEGRGKVFSRTKRGLGRIARQHAKMLIEGVA